MKLTLYQLVETKPANIDEEEDILDLLNTTPTLRYGTYPRAEFIECGNKSTIKTKGITIVQGGCRAILKTNNNLKLLVGFFCTDTNHKYIAV